MVDVDKLGNERNMMKQKLDEIRTLAIKLFEASRIQMRKTAKGNLGANVRHSLALYYTRGKGCVGRRGEVRPKGI